ncbi:MAG: winged helix-turn-helix domain-containing protein [Mogibacterium sp.]|nr:winged helix-turn-helix domain-containing protein [Mogibacterium sp.]
MDRRNRGEPFRIQMTHEQLARFLAVNRSVLSAELSKLRREGIIDYKGDAFQVLKRGEDVNLKD